MNEYDTFAVEEAVVGSAANYGHFSGAIKGARAFKRVATRCVARRIHEKELALAASYRGQNMAASG
jgi:hypothetical protein